TYVARALERTRHMPYGWSRGPATRPSAAGSSVQAAAPPSGWGSSKAPLVAPSRTYGTRRRPNDDLAGRLQRTAENLAGDRIQNATDQALQVHVDHVHRQAAARHTVTGGDLLVQHHVADPRQADVRVGRDGRVARE